MSARILSKEMASAVVVSALTCINAGAAQAVDQNENSNPPPLKQATSTSSKPGKPRPIYLTPKVAEILRLNKSGISDDVVLAYIQKSPTDYRVTSRQLIDLRDAGVSQQVLKVLAENRSPAAAELGYPPAGPSAGAQSPYEGLNSDGRWVYVPGYGWCWQPTAEQTGLFNEPSGADSLWVPPMYSSVIVGSGGFGYPYGPYVDHHGHHGTNNQHMSQHQRRSTTSGSGHTSPSLGLSGTMSPLLPVGGHAPSGNLPPYGIAGMPLMANNGANPYLPVGGTPASGSLPPYSIAGVPFTPSSGAYPYLPVGGQPANGSLPPYGVVMPPPGGYPSYQFHQPEFQFLQPSFHFLPPPFSFLPNTGTLTPGPVTSPSLSAYAYAGFHGGWGGGFYGSRGFSVGGGAFHGGGGGGHR